MNRAKTLLQRFWSFVAVNSQTGCWEWCGAQSCGYGILSRGWKKPPHRAHRLAYELFVGLIPDGLVVRHKCDVRKCVNPSHLEVGTQKENVRDTAQRGRLNPKSQLNLRPGAIGYRGAGPRSIGELQCHEE